MGAASRQNPFNQWKKDNAVSQFDLYDSYGRRLQVGDLVILPHMGPTRWRITDTKPIMDPKVPPGIVQITLAAIMVDALPGGMPQQTIVKCVDASEFKGEGSTVEELKEAVGQPDQQVDPGEQTAQEEDHGAPRLVIP